MTRALRKLFTRPVAIMVSLGIFATSFLAEPIITPASAFSGGNFPACSEKRVLDYIKKRFVWTDEKLLKRGLRIEAIDRPHQNRKQRITKTRTIGRLYCHGTAVMNDGRNRTIWYMIEAGMGFASIRDNVEFCVSGLDPWHVYGAWCRSVR